MWVLGVITHGWVSVYWNKMESELKGKEKADDKHNQHRAVLRETQGTIESLLPTLFFCFFTYS